MDVGDTPLSGGVPGRYAVTESAPNPAQDCVKISCLTQFAGQCQRGQPPSGGTSPASPGLPIPLAPPAALPGLAWTLPRRFAVLARPGPPTEGAARRDARGSQGCPPSERAHACPLRDAEG